MSTDPRIGLVLAIADDEFVLGHRLSEWTGWVPYVEEDLALSSIAQDEIGHARALYELAATFDGRTADDLAFGRTPAEYRNCHLVEHPNRDFAYTIARQWLYDTADDVRLRVLETGAFTELAQVARVLLLEERYHLEHATTWMRRLATGPVDARHRLVDALEATIGESFGIFEAVEDEERLVADGVLPSTGAAMQQAWLARVRAELETVSLDHVLGAHESPGEMIPTSAGAIEGTRTQTNTRAGLGGRRGEHSEDFEPMWEEMTALYRAHPGARW